MERDKKDPQAFFGIGSTRVWDQYSKLHVLDDDKRHEIFEVHDSVAVLVYHRDRKQVVLVKQQRPALFRHYTDASTIEVIAGHIEPKDGDVRVTMAREIDEEAGGIVDPNRIVLVNGGRPLMPSPGVMTERMWFGYVEITDTDIEQVERVFGLASENEETLRVWLGLDEFKSISFIDMKTTWMREWFFNNIVRQIGE